MYMNIMKNRLTPTVTNMDRLSTMYMDRMKKQTVCNGGWKCYSSCWVTVYNHGLNGGIDIVLKKILSYNFF
jgi:hypothetical protein